MIKLYAMPGACSLASHIVLKELDVPHEVVILKRGAPGWEELQKLNPMKQVPTLVTEEGYALAEGPAIMQYIASKKPNTVFPEKGSEHYKALEWLNFITSSLHKGFGPLFNPARVLADETKAADIRKQATETLQTAFQAAESRFSNDQFVLGKRFTIVDAYLYTVLTWARNLKFDTSAYPKINAFYEHMSALPSVLAARKAEGLS